MGGTLQNFVRQYGMREVRLHPRGALGVGQFASSLEVAQLRAARARKQVAQIAQPARRAVTDRRVRRETRRAKAYAFCASHRARRIGIAKALTDKRVARNLRKSASHAARAARFAIHPRPSHRVRNTTLAVVGTSAAAAAAYGGWKRYASSASPPRSPSMDIPSAATTADTEEGAGTAGETNTTPREA